MNNLDDEFDITVKPPFKTRTIKMTKDIQDQPSTKGLLPCPFCGSEPIWVNEAIADSHYYIKCPNCKFVIVQDRRDKVIGFWNSRTVNKRISELEAKDQTLSSWNVEALKKINELENEIYEMANSTRFTEKMLRLEIYRLGKENQRLNLVLLTLQDQADKLEEENKRLVEANICHGCGNKLDDCICEELDAEMNDGKHPYDDPNDGNY